MLQSGAEAVDVDTEERQPEFEPHRLLNEDADTPGGEQRVEHAAVEAPDDDTFDQEAEQRRHHEGERNGDQDAGVQPDAGHHRCVGADHHQLAMSHVDDAHDAVSNGETESDQQQDGADAEPDEKRVDHGITNAAAETFGGRVRGSDQVFFSFAVSKPFEVQNRLSSVSP